jgi:hypothetical protein
MLVVDSGVIVVVIALALVLVAPLLVQLRDQAAAGAGRQCGPTRTMTGTAAPSR